jgi:hypothetical protein
MGIFDFLFGLPDVESLKAKKDVKRLIKALKYKKDRDVRERAAAALGGGECKCGRTSYSGSER